MRSMTTYAPTDQAVSLNGAVPARRVRGLRFPVLPSGTLLAQLGGGLATLAGVYLAAGIAITLIVGGVAAVVLGALREAGKI